METVDEFDPAVDFPRHMQLSPRCVEWGDVCSLYVTWHALITCPSS